jgi:hypothetical protein
MHNVKEYIAESAKVYFDGPLSRGSLSIHSPEVFKLIDDYVKGRYFKVQLPKQIITPPIIPLKNFTIFNSEELADKFFKTSENGWRRSLTSSQKKSINRYKGGGYREMNPHLRGQPIDIDKADLRNIDHLTDALDKASMPETIKVYRSMRVKLDAKPGDILHDKGFTSTSTRPGVAETFDLPGTTELGKGKVVEIIVPKGSKAAYIDGLGGYNAAESEVLIQRGARYQIIQINRNRVVIQLLL